MTSPTCLEAFTSFSPIDYYSLQEAIDMIPRYATNTVTREKSPNVHKRCPKMISLEKLKILAPTQKLPKTVGDFGKLIAAKGFKKLP